ncbi:MAG: hypothetical protein ABI743_12125 [bacterium]
MDFEVTVEFTPDHIRQASAFIAGQLYGRNPARFVLLGVGALYIVGGLAFRTFDFLAGLIVGMGIVVLLLGWLLPMAAGRGLGRELRRTTTTLGGPYVVTYRFSEQGVSWVSPLGAVSLYWIGFTGLETSETLTGLKIGGAQMICLPRADVTETQLKFLADMVATKGRPDAKK